MSRPKGSKNKPKIAELEQFRFTTEQRIELVANLVVEKIIEDQGFGKKLYSLLEERDDTR